MEGMVAKRIDAPYRSGRVASRVKVKCIRRLALPIIGYVPHKGNSIATIRLGRMTAASSFTQGRHRFHGQECAERTRTWRLCTASRRRLRNR
jgi:ATP-dependent DNA ligase